MATDMDMLKRAMTVAEATLASDPDLTAPENRFAAAAMRELLAADERAMQ